MKRTYTIADTETLRQLCINNDWFSCGTESQYDRMFRMNRQGYSIEEIALVIWICSEDSWCVSEIEEILDEAHDEWLEENQ